jgi:hypothetical protein
VVKLLTDQHPRPARRPIAHAEPWKRVTVKILDRHTGYLDVMSGLIRIRHHKASTRAGLIRALIDFVAQSRIDFTRFANVDEMTDHLAVLFQRMLYCRSSLPALLERGFVDQQPPAPGAPEASNEEEHKPEQYAE